MNSFAVIIFHMSKKNRRKFQLSGQQNTAPAASVQKPLSPQSQHAAEYRIIRNDLIRVAVVNLIFFAAMLALYFSNRQSNYLEQIFAKVFKI